MSEQNEVLHNHIETLNAEVMKIQQQSTKDVGEEVLTDTSDKTIKELREVV